MVQVETAEIAPFDPCELLPDNLVGVQLRGIRRQTFQVDPSRHPIREARLVIIWLRWMGEPSQMITRRPGTSRHRCSRHVTTASELMGLCFPKIHHIRNP